MNSKNYTTLGLDLARNVLHYVIINRNSHIVERGKWNRRNLLSMLAKMRVDRVAMEACSSSHYWDRQLQTLGYCALLTPAHKEKPYVQSSDYRSQ